MKSKVVFKHVCGCGYNGRVTITSTEYGSCILVSSDPFIGLMQSRKSVASREGICLYLDRCSLSGVLRCTEEARGDIALLVVRCER